MFQCHFQFLIYLAKVSNNDDSKANFMVLVAFQIYQISKFSIHDSKSRLLI